MLLTDPLAPSLATACFVAATTIALFDLVRRFGRPRSAWPYVAVILYFALFIYTPSFGFYEVNGGWGDFQKPHETSSSFLIAILWMSVRLIGAVGGERRAWCFAVALCAFVMAAVTTVSALLCGLFFALLIAGCAISRRWRQAFLFFGFGLVTAAGLVAVLLLNYTTTGVPLDNGIEYFWPIINLRKLEHWGVLAEIVPLMSGRLGFASGTLPLVSQEMKTFVLGVLRWEILSRIYYLTLTALILWGGYIGLRRLLTHSSPSIAAKLPALHARPDLFSPLGYTFTFLATMLIATVVIGRTQPVSYVRYASFDLPLMIALVIGAWQAMTNSFPQRPRIRMLSRSVIPLLVLAVTYSGVPDRYRQNFRGVIASAASFVSGHYSIYDAYVDQKAWPGRSPEGGIRPWGLAIWRVLGPGARFWAFDYHTYCMLPDCRPETMSSFRLSPRALDILLGPADQAKAILQEENLNYFLVGMDSNPNDRLMCSALFSPDQIGQRLGIKWTDGTHSLLTWRESAAQPLSPEWLATYREAAKRAACGDWPNLQSLAEQLPHHPRWGRDLVMPWSKP
jgi:hypothetical protein